MSDQRSEAYTIGADPSCDVVINRPQVSGLHARLSQVGRAFVLEDLGATNGTFVNDMALTPRKPCRLRGGETLRLGRFTLLFHLPRGFSEFLQQRTPSQDQDQDQDDFGNANKKVI